MVSNKSLYTMLNRLNFLKIKSFWTSKKRKSNKKSIVSGYKYSLSELIGIEQKLMEELQTQQKLFASHIDASPEVIANSFDVLTKMQQDLATVKLIRLTANTEVGNNPLIIALDKNQKILNNMKGWLSFTKGTISNETKLKSILKVLKYDYTVGKLKKEITELKGKLNKNNANFKVTLNLIYPNYKFLPELP